MKRILFVKTSSLGDVVHNCPAVSDAARRFPGAAIDWVVEEPFAGVARLHGAVRRVLPVALRRWRTRAWSPAAWSEALAFRRELAREDYDRVIDTQALLKSALIARLAQGERHGMDRESAREAAAARFYDVRHAVPRGQHAVERNRRLAAEALGYPSDSAADFGLRVPQAAGAPLVPAGEAYSVFLTMTSRADKLWPEAGWIELGRRLGGRIVLPWGSEAERERAQRIAAGAGNALVAPRMEIDALARLFSTARAVVGVDTGLSHLAAALGRPTVGLYCGSDPQLTGLYAGPRAVNLGGPGRAPAVDDVVRALAERS